MEIYNNEPGSKIKKICSNLGINYTIRIIDGENVIYRDLKNGYEFEISGLDNSRSKFICTLYIWHGRQCVEIINDIISFEDLSSILSSKADEYNLLA